MINPDPVYRDVMKKYSTVRSETSERVGRLQKDKDHFLAINHWSAPPQKADEIHAIVPYTSRIDLMFSDFLSQSIPGFQAIAPGTKDQDKQLAAGVEKLIYKVLYDNYFNKHYSYFSTNLSFLGYGFFRVLWNKDDQTGGRSGSINFETPSNFRTLVAFSGSDWTEIEYWMTEDWMSPEAFKEKYDSDAPTSLFDKSLSGRQDTSDPINQRADINALGNTPTNVTNVPKVHVIKFHDNNKDVIVAAGRVIRKDEHNLGHNGLFIARNIAVPNEPFGLPNHYFATDLLSRLEAVDSRILEILNQMSVPLIFDKGNVLKGVRIDRRSGLVYTTKVWKEGEGIEPIKTDPNLQPLMAEREALVSAIHDVTGMPKAAFGAYQPGTHSGFAMTIQMQPTLMRIQVLQSAEVGPMLQEMSKYFIKILRKYGDPEIKQLLPEAAEKMTIKVKFGNPLPKDDAREVQNQTGLITNKIISRYTARENLLIENPLEEAELIAQEADNFAENPEQAMQLAARQQNQEALVKQTIAQEQLGQANPNQPLQPGQNPAQRAPTPAGEEVETSQTAEKAQGSIESIAPTSTL